MIDYDKLMRWPLPPVTRTYTERDSIVYALGLGVGRSNPVDAAHVKFIYEGASGGLAALPSMAVGLATRPFWMQDPGTRLALQRLLPRPHRLPGHTPLSPGGTVVREGRI